MKRFALLISALLLASCIMVEDFGAYWNKGVIDPTLAGHWEVVPDPGYPDDMVRYTFVKKGNEYEVHEQEDKKKGVIHHVKSLDVGPYRFFMTKSSDGLSLLRYEANETTLTVYYPKAEPMWKFIKERFPPSPNLIMENDEILGPMTKVKTLNDDIVKIFASVPKNDDYWVWKATLTKTQPKKSSKSH